MGTSDSHNDQEHLDHLVDGGRNAKHALMNALDNPTQGKIILPEIYSTPSRITAQGSGS